MENHEFALYYSQLSDHIKEKHLIISDKDLVHRITRVLRLQKGEKLTLFDDTSHVQSLISEIDRKSVTFQFGAFEKNTVLVPHITVQIGLLKRDALEQVVETLTVLGINEIQLCVSAKISRKWGGQKELERLKRVMVAAAEQSKQFVLPKLKEPFLLTQLMNNEMAGLRFFCDPDGESIKPYACKKVEDSITLFIGPEGDLSEVEKEILIQNKYLFCRLNQTILRSELAATLVAGLFRIT